MRRFWHRIFGMAMVALAQIVPGWAQPLQHGVRGRDIPVFLGGTGGFPSLADPKGTMRYRATGRGGLYVHYNATDPVLFGPALPLIAKVFEGTGHGVAELGLFHPGFFTNEWRTQLVDKGLSPKVALVNVPFDAQLPARSFTKATLTLFKAFVDEGRSGAGVMILAPVVSPNSTGGSGAVGDAGTLAIARPWADPWWDDLRTAALYGGGIALDMPPAFYLRGLPDAVQIQAYQAFAKAQLAWAAENQLAAFVIVSPFFDSGTFMLDAQRQYRSILAAGALPTAWVVENYNTCDPPYPKACTKAEAAFQAPIGRETQFGTVGSVALWFARYAQVRPYHGAYAGVMAP